MKKALLFVTAILLLFALLSTTCFASEVEEEETGLKAYIIDKIVPVAVAVLTSVLAFVTTLGTIARSLKALRSTKDDFAKEALAREKCFKEGMGLLETKTEEIKEVVGEVPFLREKIQELTRECEILAEILSLGFSANSEIIKSGKGKKMSLLLENAKSVQGEGK